MTAFAVFECWLESFGCGVDDFHPWMGLMWTTDSLRSSMWVSADSSFVFNCVGEFAIRFERRWLVVVVRS